MEGGKKVDKSQKREKIPHQSEGKGAPTDGGHFHHDKKERPNPRHSYHQVPGGANFSANGLYDANANNNSNQYGEHRSFISRERSFIRQQPTYAHAHAHESKESLQQKRRSGMSLNQRGKPAMEIYRPPTLRGSNLFDSTNGDASFYAGGKHLSGIYDSQGNFHSNSHSHFHKRQGLNIHAKEFISFQGGPPSLHHSKSSGNVNHMFQKEKGFESLHHSKSGHNLRDGGKHEGGNSLSKVHFSENKENDPDAKAHGMTHRTPPLTTPGPTQSPIKRSKSLGSADLRHTFADGGGQDLLGNVGPFSQEVHRSISEAMNDPNKLSARQLMEAVRHVFSRVIESSRHSEPIARICINIIEKEKDETFLETLLNTCQEFYQERDRLLRNSQITPYPGYVASHPRWIAYMSFLNEMYTQLKRRHIQLMTLRMRNSETPPGLHLLTLLAQCCYVCLRGPSVNSLSETECLFFVLTAVGKDIEVKLPQHMARVMGAARDAFLMTVHVPAVRKTLLQLIEMNAARWQLPAPAVMYYYPGSGAK